MDKSAKLYIYLYKWQRTVAGFQFRDGGVSMAQRKLKTRALERGAGVALWRQIQGTLAEELRAKIWRPGQRLPGEHDLARRFQVNRHTVRRALQALEDRGLVRIEQGRGTTVSETRIDYAVRKRTRFSEIMAEQRVEVRGRILGTARVPADDRRARALGIERGEPVARVERISVVNGRPLSLATHHFSERRFPGILDDFPAEQSITKVLARRGVVDYVRRRTTVRSEIANPADARRLEVPPGSPVLVAESINVDTGGDVVEFGVARFDGGRVQLLFEP
jgi:GntR family phosphonate transport system transcriptional regulator